MPGHERAVGQQPFRPGRRGPGPAGLGCALAVFIVWRLLHLLVVALFGGDAGETTYAFDGGYYLSILRGGYVRPAGGYAEFSKDLPG